MSAAISDNAMTLLKARYLSNGESVEDMFWRVAGGNQKYYDLLESLRFMTASPVLFNMGLNNGCTSSPCFVFDVDDEMGPLPTDNHRSIVNTRGKAIAVAKAGGGVGYYFGNLRKKGSPVRTTHRVACGPVAVLRDYQAVSPLITQGGKRDLAQMGVLPCWHPDILEFVHSKDEDPQAMNSFNISVSWTDEYIQRAFDNTLSPEGKLWDEQVESAWKHGCPGMFFHDVVNKHSNFNTYLGLLNAGNPCQPGFATVLAPGGVLTFDDINVGSIIWSGRKWTSVVKKVSTGVKQVFIWHTDGGSFVGTKDHRVFQNGERIAVEFADYIDGCINPNDVREIGSFKITRSEDLGEMPVFDITVDAEEHSYWTDGLLVSNCSETPNRSDEPCSLASLNLGKYYTKSNRGVDFARLADDAYLALEFMDDILDRNTFPHPEITKAALLTRKLGLGVMGWADLLALMHIHYDTQDAVNLGGMVMSTIRDATYAASRDIGKIKGPYLGFSEDKTNGPFARNETRTSIAPTGSISIIANCSSSIEPHYALEWERTTKEGFKFKEKISVWEELEGFVPKTAHEISPEWHIKHQAIFQKYTDLGVSKTINMSNSATKEDVSSAYMMMYKTGCEGGTVFRDGCRNEQVLVSTKKTSVFTTGLKENLPTKKHMPSERQSLTHKFVVSGTDCFLTVGLFEDGKPGEIFMRASRLGSTIGGMLDSWAISFSIALQSGTPLERLCKHHIGTRFEPSGVTSNKEIPVCTSIPDYVSRWLEMKFLNKKEPTPASDSGMFCPDCGREAIYQGGCLTCASLCGWSRC